MLLLYLLSYYDSLNFTLVFIFTLFIPCKGCSSTAQQKVIGFVSQKGGNGHLMIGEPLYWRSCSSCLFWNIIGVLEPSK